MHLALQPAAEILNRPPGKVVADLGGLSASSICFPKDAAANLAALRTGEVHVWLSFIHSDPVAEKLFWNTLSAEERQRAEKIQVAADRAGFVLAHALVRAVLSQYHSIAPGAWQFGHGVQGKPFISAPAGAPPLQFNLSHTNGLAACAVTWNAAVGVDVEHIKPHSDLLAVAREFFPPAVAQELSNLSSEERTVQFYELWTRREAFGKACGVGLTPTSSVSEIAEGWQFFQLRVSPDHFLAAAIRDEQGSTSVFKLRMVTLVG
jgi:4'-phosphopantetheinyl transferase